MQEHTTRHSRGGRADQSGDLPNKALHSTCVQNSSRARHHNDTRARVGDPYSCLYTERVWEHTRCVEETAHRKLEPIDVGSRDQDGERGPVRTTSSQRPNVSRQPLEATHRGAGRAHEDVSGHVGSNARSTEETRLTGGGAPSSRGFEKHDTGAFSQGGLQPSSARRTVALNIINLLL